MTTAALDILWSSAAKTTSAKQIFFIGKTTTHLLQTFLGFLVISQKENESTKSASAASDIFALKKATYATNSSALETISCRCSKCS